MAEFLKIRFLPVIAYPSVLTVGLILHHAMRSLGLGQQVSSLVPILVGVVLITLLEFVIPYRGKWRPSFTEVRTDILFTVVVQVMLPKLLAFMAAISFLDYVKTENLVLFSIWPHHWHLSLQVILMLVCAEFLRYWLHRAAHYWSPLWRLHAVHHSPDKLYWLNTSRFHPVEKAIQFLFDSLPFIFLGVSVEVLSIYFVFYALNGFFQHSNVDLRMGWLNYIISTAQLHRWHHSKAIQESGTNYGNNLIIWDLLFGSWFLPKDRQVGELGLFNRKYPMSFFEQMGTPFTPGIDKIQVAMFGIKEICLNLRTQIALWLSCWVYKLPFSRALSHPMRHQKKLLNNIIKWNKHTRYGTLHEFGEIKSHQDFIRHIPIQGYDDLYAFVEEQEQTRQPLLSHEQPQYYAATSGTTGNPKYIPVLNTTIDQHRKALAIFACAQSKFARHAFGGTLLAIPGAYHEGELKGGSKYGSISGLLYFLMPSYLQQKYCVPHEVFALHDHELKYRLIIRLAIQHANISYMVSANPSTFLKLIDIINIEIGIFADELERGAFNAIGDLPEHVAGAVGKLLRSDKPRAETLRNLQQSGKEISYADIWPNLRLLVTWTGGSCGLATNSLKKLLPDNTKVLELGYLASELRGTITLEDTGSSGVPTIRDNYFEFIDVDAYERGEQTTKLLDNLSVGNQYYVVVTTPAGLYRYFMNDIVEVTGYRDKTPLIRFVQKGRGVTNITGEKLTEQQLVIAMEAVNNKTNTTVPFYIVLASVKENRYKLYLEAEADAEEYSKLIDSQLQVLNTEYRSKRASGRLKPLIAIHLQPGSGQAFKSYFVAKGQRESQFKFMLLQNQGDCEFPLDDFIL